MKVVVSVKFLVNLLQLYYHNSIVERLAELVIQYKEEMKFQWSTAVNHHGSMYGVFLWVSFLFVLFYCLLSISTSSKILQ